MQNCFSRCSICHRSMFTHSLSLLQLTVIIIIFFSVSLDVADLFSFFFFLGL